MLNKGSIEDFCSHLMIEFDEKAVAKLERRWNEIMAKFNAKQQAEQARQEQARLAIERHEAEEAQRLQEQQAEQARIAQIQVTKKWIPHPDAQRRWDETIARLARQEQARLAHQRQLAAKEEAYRHHEAEEARKLAEAFACRRCPARFSSNTKLHQHIEDHHAKKPKPEPLHEAPTPASTRASTEAPAIPPATPPQMAPMPVPASEAILSISLPITSPATLAIIFSSTSTKLAVAILMSPTSSHTSVLQLQESHNQSTNHITKRSYMIIDDLFAMFAGKQQKHSLSTIQTSAPSSPPRQTRIIVYFKFQSLGTAKPFRVMSSSKCKK